MNKYLQRLIMLTVFVISAVSWIDAQRTISGTVKDESGEPMIGVNILVMGTTIGTVSDFDGGYTLQVPAGATQLQFSYTGYDRVLVDLGASAVIDVVMGEGAILEDVVVTGYGTVRRENVTGAISTVNSKDFNRGSIASAQELITGKIAGVSIVTGGDPGAGSTIRIRGGSSLSATNDPLVIIDGVPIASDQISGSRNFLNIVNPNDIATFTVLKDASATAIYGSRASNGVILITTKKGSLGTDLSVNYSGNVSMSTIAKRADVLTASEFTGLVNSRYPEGSVQRSLLGTSSTDWQDEVFQNALGHDHNLSVSGSFGEVPFRISGGYTNKDGLITTDNFNRLTASLNINPAFLDNKLQFNFSAKGMLDKNHFADQGAIGNSVFFDPTQPIRSDDPAYAPYGGYYTYLNADGSPNTLSPRNPLAVLNLIDNNSTVKRYILGAQADYRFWFLEALRLNINAGYDFSNGEGENFTSPQASWTYTTGGRHETYAQDNTNTLFESFLDYQADLGSDFNLGLMGGYSWQHFEVESTGSTYDYVDTAVFTAPYLDAREYYLLSVFGRLNLTMFEDFLLTVSVRRDGTSRFSEDNRWGTFPGVALAWKMLNGDGAGSTSLKLRLGYGLTGQQGISPTDYYPYLPRYSYGTPTATYQFGNEYVTVLRPSGYDANIKWEETTTYNLGVDYSILDDRLSGAIDFYLRKTSDLINFIPVAAGTNLTNFLLTNVGDLENRGVEFSLNTIPWRSGKNEWAFGFNVAYNKNEITKLTATDDPNYQGVGVGDINGGVGNQIQIHSVGFPANSFYVWEQVYDASGVPIEGLYVDRNEDGVINNADLYRYKKAAPDLNFGFSTSLTVGQFDLSASARAMVGNYIYNNNLSNQAVLGFLFTPGGGVGGGYLGNLNAAAQSIDFSSPRYFSDHFIQDGSFFRIDNISAGYNFGSIGTGIQSLRASLTVQNPLLITNYDGIDPEIFSGIDNNIYPRSRTFVFGINVGF